jgi:hypothetical protein
MALIPWITIFYALLWTIAVLILTIVALFGFDFVISSTKWCCYWDDTTFSIMAILAIAASVIAFVALVIAYVIDGVI